MAIIRMKDKTNDGAIIYRPESHLDLFPEQVGRVPSDPKHESKQKTTAAEKKEAK